MNEALTHWLNKLDSTTLPVLQGSQRQLEELLRDDNVHMGQLATVIEHDMGLSLHLMRFIKGVSTRHLRNDVNTVNHALMLLGLNSLRRLPNALVTIESLHPSVQALLQSFFAEAHHCAYQASQWALLRKDFEPDEVYLAALLHNIGETLLWLYDSKQMLTLRTTLKAGQLRKEEAEQQILGFSIQDLTRELAKQWGLPELFRDSLYPENAHNVRVYGVMLAVQLARLSRTSWTGPVIDEIIEEIADYLFLGVDETTALLHRFAAEAARGAMHIDSPPAILNLISPRHRPGQTTALTPVATTLPPNDNQAQQRLYQKAVKELAASAGKLPLKEIIATTLAGIHEGLAMERVVFALLSHNRNYLQARSIVGADNDPRFNRFAIELGRNHLFDRLLEKPQSFWFDQHNRIKFIKAMPRDFLDITHSECFMVMSLFVSGKPIGIFYADRGPNCRTMDETLYKRFKLIVTQASIALNALNHDSASTLVPPTP